MSNGEGRKVTLEDIDRVKNLIEECIMNYKTKKEVINFLHQQHNIEPCFTKIVWKNLEEQNQDFFKNYYLRLMLIDQIKMFNDLVDKQASILDQLNPNEVAAAAASFRPPSNLAEQSVPFDLPPPHALNINGGLLRLQHSQFNTMLARNQNVGMTNNGDLGNTASSSNMDTTNSLQLQRTFTDDLSAFLTPHPGYSLFESNGVTVENQGAPNTSSNLNFQNPGFVDMSQRSNIFK